MEIDRPSVSRDTRMLFTIILVALGMLWALARIRFPDREPTANPVPAVLAQLAPPSAFDDIAASVAQLEPRIQPGIVAVGVEARDGSGAPATSFVAALRFREDLAVALIPAASEPLPEGAVGVARDPASHLMILRVPGGAAPPLSLWSPRRPDAPRFLIAASATRAGISLRPVFVGSLHPIEHPVWPEPIWLLSAAADLAEGTFVYNVDGALAGLVVQRENGLALVPADDVIVLADRLGRSGQAPPAHVGVEVAPLTPEIAAAADAATGVVVTWVDPRGPAADQLKVADVIEKVDSATITTLEHWQARSARFTEGQPVMLSVRRRGAVVDVALTAAAVAVAPEDWRLGLTLRTARGVGAEITGIEPRSAAARAGLRVGDVLTMVGDREAPTAAQASGVFRSAPADRPLLIGFTRAGSHHVLALTRTW